MDIEKEVSHFKCEYSKCQKDFEKKKSSHRHMIRQYGIDYKKFCSTACGFLYYTPQGVLEDYQDGMSSIEIGKKYEIHKGRVIRAARYAGMEIRGRGDHLSGPKNPTRGKGHTAEAKKKISEAAIKQFSDPAQRERVANEQRKRIEDGVYSRVSSIEKLVARELDHRDIEYQKGRSIKDQDDTGYCYPDFIIGNVALEVNGTFWHADPRKYLDGPKYHTQKHNLEKYERKLKILKSHNIKLVEIWEIDIEEDINKAVDDALKRIAELNT